VQRSTIRLRLAVVIALSVGFTLVTLTSLCYASPPDPTWIAGLYDDDDHDDVVLEVSAIAAVPVAVDHTSTPGAVAEAPWASRRAAPSPPSLTALLDRSPPLV
jgi:hypothetical protein